MNRYHLGFLFLVAVIGAFALVFSVQTLIQYLHYYRLDASTPLLELTLKPKPLAHDQYVLAASYRYLDYSATEILNETSYKNRYAAEVAAQEKMNHLQHVWYNNQNPAYSSLEKQISYKQIAYTVVLWALTTYFIFLCKYVRINHAASRINRLG